MKLNSILSRICKRFHKKYISEIKDIILFGSVVRGKVKPSDIDIVLIFFEKIDKDIEYELKKLLSGKTENVSIISKTEKNYLDPSFDGRESILFEGYSLVNSKYIASANGYASFGLFIYNTNKIDNTTKTKFYYALNGRGDSSGAVDSFEGIKLSDNIIAVPLEKIEIAKDFFEFWKIYYRYVPSLVPKRQARKSILGKVIYNNK